MLIRYEPIKTKLGTISTHTHYQRKGGENVFVDIKTLHGAFYLGWEIVSKQLVCLDQSLTTPFGQKKPL